MKSATTIKRTRIIITSATAALMSIAILAAAVYMLFFSSYEAPVDSRVDDRTSAVILSYRGDKTTRIQNRWLVDSLEYAGIPVCDLDIAKDEGSVDQSALISRWHNWKQERSINQGNVWLISSGLEADMAVEIALAWEDSNLLILSVEDRLKYFTDWQDFTASLPLRWTEDRSLLIYYSDDNRKNAADIFEKTSNEDAWLFPGEQLYLGDDIRVINSSDGSSLLAEIDTGLLNTYGWSSSYLDSITSELVTRSVENESAVDTAARIDQAYKSIRLEWFLLAFAIMMFMLTVSIAGLADTDLAALRMHREKEIVEEEQAVSEEIRAGRFLIFLRFVLMSAVIAIVLILFTAVGLLPLLTFSWWLTALTLVFVMILLIPDARLGIADRHQERTSFIRMLSGLIWLVIAVLAVLILIRSLVVEPVPRDSVIWLFSGLGLLIAGRAAVRRLVSVKCRVWLALPAGAWLIINGVSIISRFTGFY